MIRMNRSWGLGLIVVALIFGGIGVAPAQTLVGNWGPIMHEDQPERGGGLRVPAFHRCFEGVGETRAQHGKALMMLVGSEESSE